MNSFFSKKSKVKQNKWHRRNTFAIYFVTATIEGGTVILPSAVKLRQVDLGFVMSGMIAIPVRPAPLGLSLLQMPTMINNK
jgi:hypothetical protein